PGGATIEGGGRQPADARADDDEVVTLLDRQPVEREALAFARLRMRGLERARVLSAQSGERGRIAQRLRRDLCRWRKAGGDRQSHAIEEGGAQNRRHARAKARSVWTMFADTPEVIKIQNPACAIGGPSAYRGLCALPTRPPARPPLARLRGAAR